MKMLRKVEFIIKGLVDLVLRIDSHINGKLERDEFSVIDEERSHLLVKLQDACYYVQIFFKFVLDNR